MTKKTQLDFNTSTKKAPHQEYHTLVIPAHKSFDGISCREDALSGKLGTSSHAEGLHTHYEPESELELKKLFVPKPRIEKISAKGKFATVAIPAHKVYDFDAIKRDAVTSTFGCLSEADFKQKYIQTVPKATVRVKNDKPLERAAVEFSKLKT